MSTIQPGRRRRVGVPLCIQPNINISGSKSKQAAQLDRIRKVAAVGVAVIDGLLSQPEIGGKRLGREELVHGSLAECNHMTAFSIGATYRHLPRVREPL